MLPGPEKRPRILCLHGMRTSGLILSRQMASLRYHVEADFVFIDGPFKATGPPQEVITQYYPNLPYYEWQSANEAEGLNWLLDYLSNEDNGSFDGILGFSQGARMTARIVIALTTNSSEYTATPDQLERIRGQHSLQFFVFIGGVSPISQNTPPPSTHPSSICPDLLTAPSLHIMGEQDPFIEHSRRLASFFSPETSRVLVHPESHNIPSKRTGP